MTFLQSVFPAFRHVSRINVSDSSPTLQKVGHDIFERPSGVAVYNSANYARDEHMNSSCGHLNGGCKGMCLATPSGHRCACRDGLILVNGSRCVDADECASDPCQNGGTCFDKPNAFTCLCRRGFSGQLCEYSLNPCRSYPCMNGGSCRLFFSGFRCVCLAGFTGDVCNLQEAAGLTEDNFLLVADSKRGALIQIGLSNGTSWKIPLSRQRNPIAVVHDPVDMKLYWTDVYSKVIKRSNLDGTYEERVLSVPERSNPNGMAIDIASRLLYYTDTGLDIIAVVTLNGKQHLTLVEDGMDEPRGIVLHPATGLMYWTDWGLSPKIEVAAMDGTNRSVLVRFKSPSWPNGITLDPNEKRLYWCDGQSGTIEYMSLDGRNRKILITTSDTHFFGIAFMSPNLYITDWRSRHVSKIKVSNRTSTPQKVGPNVFGRPCGLAVYNSANYARAVHTKSACSQRNGGCKESMCLAIPGGRRCGCPEGTNMINGTLCVEIGACESNPCQNGATCVHRGNAFECKCLPFFRGVTCQFVLNPCRSHPCMNGGSCRYQFGAYRCTCPGGFTGVECESSEFHKDVCASTPCHNGGTCVDKRNMFECKCRSSFSGPVCEEAMVYDNFLIVTDSGRGIFQVDISSEQVWQIPLSQQSNPVAVAYDPVDSKIYWTDVQDKVIKRANLDGTDEDVVRSLNRSSIPDGMAIDITSRLLYYTDTGLDIIAVMTLDGKQHITLVDDGMDQPRGIVLQIVAGLMYWTDWGVGPKIEVAAMDGTNRRVLVRISPPSWPNGLAIDRLGKRLYWCDAHHGTIESVTLDGRDRNVLAKVPMSHFFGIIFIATNVYFTDWNSGYVSTMKLSDSTPIPKKFGPNVFSRANGITAYNSTIYGHAMHMTSPCSHHNGGCKHMCLSTPNGPRCPCTEGLKYANGTECSERDECASKPCQNGGLCVNNHNALICVCTHSFTGRLCEIGHIATVPASNKKQIDISIRLLKAEFKTTLKDKDSNDYITLRNKMEHALNEILDDVLGGIGEYTIVDVTFRAGSLIVIYRIEMLKDSVNASSIEASIKNSDRSFAGFHLDLDKVVVSDLSIQNQPRKEKKASNKGAVVGLVVGVVVGIILLGVVIWGAIYRVKTRSAQREGQEELTAEEFVDTSLSLEFSNPGYDIASHTDNSDSAQSHG